MRRQCRRSAGPRCKHFCLKGRPTPKVSTLSLHDALPILCGAPAGGGDAAGRLGVYCGAEAARAGPAFARALASERRPADRKSTRLNSSHPSISYAVFCLKKKIKNSDDAGQVLKAAEASNQ